jgi:hypothetical protein
MTTVNAGTTGSLTFVTNDSLLITLDANEVASVNVSDANGTKFQAELRKTQVIGPFAVGDVAKITADRGDIDYLVVSQELFGVHAYVTQEQKSVPGVAVVGVLSVGDDGQIYLPDGTVSVAGSGSTTYSGLTDKATADLPVINTPLAAALALKADQTDLDATNATVSGQATQISDLSTDLTALSDLEAADVADLQAQIDGIEISTPGAITGLTDGAVVDNATIFTSFLDTSGSIMAVDGVRSEVPASGDYLVASTINSDPQINLDWGTRGAITLIPDPRLPGLTPGTFNSGTRTGGFAPGSVLRIPRRSPNINKQAYEHTCAVSIDGTGVTASKAFTCNASGVFTSTAHGRQNGDIIFFDTKADGTDFPTGIVNGNDSKYTQSYKVSSVTTNTFKVSSWDNVGNDYNAGTVTTSAGSGIWSTNVAGVRIPKNSSGGSVSAGSAAMDPDQDFDDKKEYTAGRFSDADIRAMSGSGLISEGGSGRLHVESHRALNNRLHGYDIASNDTVLSGHWGGGGNGGFTLKKGSGTGLYAVTGNIWGKPTNRSKSCGAVWCNDTAYFALVANQPNDWCRFDGDNNFNASGVFGMNMVHPHAENYSSDGVGINVLNDGDLRLQSNIGVTGYQGLVLGLNSWTRTETVEFDTPGNFGGNTTMSGGKVLTGTAPQYLAHFNSGAGSRPSMVQIFDGVCTAPDVKPWQGPFSTVTVTIAAPGVFTWTAHPLVVGDRVFFHTTGALPTGLTADSVAYYVTTVPTVDTFTVSATYGATTGLTTSGTQSGTHTCYQLSSSPYYIAGSSKIGGVYFDSYTGNFNFWSRNGTSGSGGSGKALIQTSKNDSWEGNPNFQVEIGDRTLGSGVPKFHQMIYGALELDYAPGLRSVTTATNRTTVSSGNSKNVDAYAGRWVMNITGGSIASATFNLPGGMTSSYELVLTINGTVTAVTWGFNGSSSLNSKSLALPASIAGCTVVRLQFSADNNDWLLISVNGVRGWTALTDAASIATPAFCDQEGKFSVTLGGNRTLANPSGPLDGQKYIYRLTQDGTGNRVITWGNKFKFPGGAPVLSTAAGAIDLVTGVYDATTNLIYAQLTKAYA